MGTPPCRRSVRTVSTAAASSPNAISWCVPPRRPREDPHRARRPSSPCAPPGCPTTATGYRPVPTRRRGEKSRDDPPSREGSMVSRRCYRVRVTSAETPEPRCRHSSRRRTAPLCRTPVEDGVRKDSLLLTFFENPHTRFSEGLPCLPAATGPRPCTDGLPAPEFCGASGAAGSSSRPTVHNRDAPLVKGGVAGSRNTGRTALTASRKNGPPLPPITRESPLCQAADWKTTAVGLWRPQILEFKGWGY